MAHVGLGVTVLGIVAVTAFETEHIVEMKPGDDRRMRGGYTLRFDGHAAMATGRTTPRTAAISPSGAAASPWPRSGRRSGVYTARQMPTTEAGILTFGLSQLYVSLGDATTDGGIVVRIWWKPLILCIWGGALFMMALGGAGLAQRPALCGRRAAPGRSDRSSRSWSRRE